MFGIQMCLLIPVVIFISYFNGSSPHPVKARSKVPSLESVSWCDKMLASNNVTMDVNKCQQIRQDYFQHEMSKGKSAVYMRKLWRAFSHEKDKPGGTQIMAKGRLPNNVDLINEIAHFFSQCEESDSGMDGTADLDEKNLTRIELIVPHNHTSNDPLHNGRPLATVDVNGEYLQPSIPTIIDNSTLIFDLTFLISNGSNELCQNVSVTFFIEPYIHVDIDKTLLYEYYNFDDVTFDNFRNLTKRLKLKTHLQRKGTKRRLTSPNRRRRQIERCSVRRLTVDLHRHFGMNWVLFPRQINIGQCEGLCSRSPDIHGASEYTTSHAILLNNFEKPFACDATRQVTCVPNKMGSKTLQYSIRLFSIVTKSFPAMIIKSCRCV